MQTPSSDCLNHCISNDQYQLRLSLSDSRLVINLNDYTDWIVYEKNYTEEDIGKQIHRKLELIDIYSAFYDIKEKSQNEKNKINYKIESGGKITTYTEVQLNRKGAQVEEIYESKLQLNKKQDIKQIDIMMIRANIEKKEVVSKFQARIEQISKSNAQSKNNIKEMQKQIKRLNESNQKLTEMVIEIQKQQKDQQQLNKTIQKQLAALIKLNQCVKLDSGSPFFSKFQVSKNQITYIGEANNFTQFIVDQKIPNNKFYKFTFKIVKSVSRNIMIGVIQKSKQISSRSSYGSNNVWCFYGPGTGYKYPGSITEGKGYNVGDLVEIQVRLKEKSIVWNINGQYNASFKDISRFSNFSSNESFYPYVELYENGECVQWMGSSES